MKLDSPVFARNFREQRIALVFRAQAGFFDFFVPAGLIYLDLVGFFILFDDTKV